MGKQLDLFIQEYYSTTPLLQTAAFQSQSVSNGALSQGSETEQQRQRQFRAQMEQFEDSIFKDPPLSGTGKKKNRTTQQSKPNYYEKKTAQTRFKKI